MPKMALDRACIGCGGKVWYVYPNKRTSARCVACAHEYANISHAHRRALMQKVREYEEVLELIAAPPNLNGSWLRDRAVVQQLAKQVLEKFNE